MFTACILLSAGPGLPADEPTSIEAVATRIHNAEEYTLRVSIPDTKEQVFRFRYQGNNDTVSRDNWTGWRVVPYLLPLATAPDGKGQVVLAFEFPGENRPLVLRSKGPADDIYLVRALGLNPAAKRWLGKQEPESPTVVKWSEKEPELDGEPLKKIPLELAAPVKLGKAAYEARRPELVRRFNRSYLYYPAAETARWSVTAGKGVVYLETGCSDLMYYARFRVELRKTLKGEWEVTRILALEAFKGE
ncbi:MAG TPA: hypothetical protein VKE74_10995 [Gemmataceae bacterium]|nr:hypothetical protein [Gemmataceae bacterium]